MTSNTIKIRRIGIFSSGFQLILFLVFLYLVFYFSRQYHIPVLGTVAKWILIVILGIIGLVVGIFILILLFSIILLTFAFFKNKKLQDKVKKERELRKIKILNPSKNTGKRKKKEDVIVEGEYK